MTGFQRLLVPVDFSAHSVEATRVAADLARRFDASLTLIHVYDPMIYALPDGFIMVPQTGIDKLFDAFRSQLDSARRQALDAGAPRVETKLIEGFVAAELVELAKRGEFDLIVMGTHGRTGMSHVVIGSIAERVVRLSPCPVLTVKRPGSKALQ
jgi:nucleotide-binding universal stress UspA family protein